MRARTARTQLQGEGPGWLTLSGLIARYVFRMWARCSIAEFRKGGLFQVHVEVLEYLKRPSKQNKDHMNRLLSRTPMQPAQASVSLETLVEGMRLDQPWELQIHGSGFLEGYGEVLEEVLDIIGVLLPIGLLPLSRR